MKRTTELIVFMFIGTMTFAQVPNGGFENWTGTEPDNWITNNISQFELYPVTQSSDAHSGAFALRAEVIENTSGSNEVYNPIIQSVGGVPVTQDHASFSGWYKFNPIQATASFTITCSAFDAGGQFTGVGALEIDEGSAGYTTFNVPIDYDFGSSEPTAIINISFVLADSEELSASGSWFLIDDLTFDGATDLPENDLMNAEVGIPYPIPFLDKLSIPITVRSSSNYKVEVIDLVGRPIEIIVNDILAQGTHLLDWTPGQLISNGVYFIRISDAEGSTVRRVLLER